MVGADVAALRAEMKAGGRPLYEVTDGNVGRVIDMRWFTTEAARFRLAGVVNRLDRHDFAEIGGDKGCGEVRLIYRLAYAFKKKGKLLASRLPVDFNAVYSVAPDADGGCTGVAGRWKPQLDEAVDAGWLAGGPIDHSELSFKQLELNAQVVRFPVGPGDRVRRAGRLSDAHFRHRRRHGHREGAGEHARHQPALPPTQP